MENHQNTPILGGYLPLAPKDISLGRAEAYVLKISWPSQFANGKMSVYFSLVNARFDMIV